MAKAPETLPNGVVLQDWDDFPAQRKDIFHSVQTAVQQSFPHSQGGVRLELHDLHYTDPEQFTHEEEKHALLGNKFLHRRLRGTYKLYDEKNGEQLDQKEATVMRVPYLTDRGTFIHNGSEYTTLRQARLQPGVYARRKASGELESHFNAKRGTGHSFRVRLEPETGLMKLDIGQSSLRLYSLLKDLGVSDTDLEKRWGKQLLQTNKEGYDARVFEKAYQRLVRRPDPNHDREAKAQAIKAALADTKLDRAVMERTLPNLFNAKQAAAWQQTVAEPALVDDGDFDKKDYLLLADLMDEKFNAGIPLNLPAASLVQRIRESLQQMMPGINPDMLAASLEKSAGAGSAGCLMAVLESADAATVVDWTQEHVPADKLVGEGVEHEPHVTVRYGFKSSLDVKALKKMLKQHGPVRFTLGPVTRFKNGWDGKADVLILKVDSPELVALYDKINEDFEKDLEKPTYKGYRPHLTLAYVEKGSLKSLEQHARFVGHTYVLKKLIYSTAGSKQKIEIPLEED